MGKTGCSRSFCLSRCGRPRKALKHIAQWTFSVFRASKAVVFEVVADGGQDPLRAACWDLPHWGYICAGLSPDMSCIGLMKLAHPLRECGEQIFDQLPSCLPAAFFNQTLERMRLDFFLFVLSFLLV